MMDIRKSCQLPAFVPSSGRGATSCQQKGQIALIVLLVMVVVLTIGLSVASRSVTDIYLSESKEAGIRAFNAAEAGIEEALSRVNLAGESFDVSVGDITANVNVEELNTLETLVKRNDVIEVPLSGGSATGVRISWTREEDGEQNPDGVCEEDEGGAPASIEIIRLRQELAGVVGLRYLYNAPTCAIVNGFETAAAGSDGFVSSVTLPDPSIDGDPADGVYDIALRIRTFYNKATVAVLPTDGELPSQEYRISSTATTETGETRAVELTRSASALPAIFDYALFSGSNLTK